ncbi:MAG: alpha/beta hydrolase [Actinomycetota bacterium]|nr:alpha/beta hydrolase [Actinomycetota bacterium]
MNGFVEAFRERVSTASSEPGMSAGPLYSVEDAMAGLVPIRVYRPTSEIAPVVCYLHGAGFIAGDLDSHDQICRLLASQIGAVVVAADYRLAPEHPFPAAVDDAFSVVEWILDNAAQFGADDTRWAVVGDSAGGNLAAVVAQRWRDWPHSPVIQALVCPVLELADFDLPSHHSYADGDGFTTAAMRQMADLYLGDTTDRRDPLVSPARAESLAGLPPAVIISAELDPLRDDGEMYARRLVEAGVPVMSFRQPNMAHYGVLWCRAAPEIAPGFSIVADALTSALHPR